MSAIVRAFTVCAPCSSIVMTTGGETAWLGLPLLGLLGFLGALAGGLGLLVSIMRSGRRD